MCGWCVCGVCVFVVCVWWCVFVKFKSTLNFICICKKIFHVRKESRLNLNLQDFKGFIQKDINFTRSMA